MKLLFFSFSLLFLGGYTCSRTEKPLATTSLSMDTIKVDTTYARITFDSDIKPIFINHCQPCHFPGGKMYEKMPFDKAQTIRDHQAGILRRIKEPGEIEKLKAFLAQTEIR